MDTSINFISPEAELAPAQDFEALRREAIDLIIALGAETWSDHNLHDPGITLLEAICYTLTDLSYRLDHSIPDLLARTDDQDPFANLPRAHELLPAGPVTFTDLRKVLIDLPGVKNAWISKETEPVPLFYYDPQEHSLTFSPTNNESVRVTGLIKVAIERELGDQQTRQQFTRLIKDKLFEVRNLCEDFADPEILRKERVSMRSLIELYDDSDPTEVLVTLFEKLQDYISPPIHFYSYEEMLAKGYSREQILEGPLLRHGFIDEAELAAAQPRTELRSSDIIRVLADIPEVKLVKKILLVGERNFSYVPEGSTSPEDYTRKIKYPWFLPITEGYLPELDMASCQIELQVGGISINSDLQAAITLYMERKQAALPKPTDPASRLPAYPAGTYRAPGQYSSLQNHLPELFGVGEYGLSANEPAARKAQVKQLQGYLYHTDQIMGNQYAQLEHFKDLFSFQQIPEHARYSQPVDQAGYRLAEVINPWVYPINYRLDNDLLYVELAAGNFTAGEQLTGAKNGDVGLSGYYTVLRHEAGNWLLQKQPGVTYAGEHPFRFALKRSPQSLEALISRLTDPREQSALRRERNYSHLLARYGEQLPDFTKLFAYNTAQLALLSNISLAQKRQLLYHYPRLSHRSFQGFNYSLPARHPDNEAGLMKRLRLLLGMTGNHQEDILERRQQTISQLTQHYQLAADSSWDQFFAAVTKRAGLVISAEQLQVLDASGQLVATRAFSTTDDPEQAIDQEWLRLWHLNISMEGLYLIEHILLRPRQFEDLQAQILLELHKSITDISKAYPAEEFLVRIHSPRHNLEINEQVQIKVPYLNTPGDTYELYQVVESYEDNFVVYKNPLPAALKNYLASKDEAGQELNLDDPDPQAQGIWRRSRYRKDPYSLQLSLVLPDWPGRCQHAGYRAQVEQQLRESIPAHLYLYIYWLDTESMERIEHYLYHWKESLNLQAHGKL